MILETEYTPASLSSIIVLRVTQTNERRVERAAAAYHPLHGGKISPGSWLGIKFPNQNEIHVRSETEAKEPKCCYRTQKE